MIIGGSVPKKMHSEKALLKIPFAGGFSARWVEDSK
jgi:hypothetical protein